MGTLLIESRRHFLDFEEMSAAEFGEYGKLLRRLYTFLRQLSLGVRIYNLVLLEGASHFHAWLVPKPQGAELSGLAFLSTNQSCDPDEVTWLVRKLKDDLSMYENQTD